MFAASGRDEYQSKELHLFPKKLLYYLVATVQKHWIPKMMSSVKLILLKQCLCWLGDAVFFPEKYCSVNFMWEISYNGSESTLGIADPVGDNN